VEILGITKRKQRRSRPRISSEREAEELRSGIEKLIEDADLVRNMCSAYADDRAVPASELIDLLDRVDARDSLKFLERKTRRARPRAKVLR